MWRISGVACAVEYDRLNAACREKCPDPDSQILHPNADYLQV
jgi:hypothetical protein